MRTPKLITIEIQTADAAFDDNEGAEVARVLHRFAVHCQDEGVIWDRVRLLDLNGNTCGFVTIKGVS